jgi:hypothetical protein
MPDRRAFTLGTLAALFAGLRAYADVPSDAAVEASNEVASSHR